MLLDLFHSFWNGLQPVSLCRITLLCDASEKHITLHWSIQNVHDKLSLIQHQRLCTHLCKTVDIRPKLQDQLQHSFLTFSCLDLFMIQMGTKGFFSPGKTNESHKENIIKILTLFDVYLEKQNKNETCRLISHVGFSNISHKSHSL